MNWNPFRSSYSRMELLRELMGIEGEGPTSPLGWLTQFGKCVFVTAAVAGTVLMLAVGVSILGGGK